MGADRRAVPASPVAVLGGLVVALQICWPLAGHARHLVTIAVVVAFAAASSCHAVATRGPRTGLLVLLATAGLGFAAEVVGVGTGIPFGSYRYTGTLGPEVAGVPVVVALAWSMFAWPAVVVAQRLARTRGRRIAVAAWSLASWDLFLDPQMVGAGHWVWAHPSPHLPGVPTVPLTNLAGWVVVATLVAAAALSVAGPGGAGRDDRWPIALFLWTYFSSVLALGAFLGQPAAAAWGALGMAPVVLALLASLRRPTAAAVPLPQPSGAGRPVSRLVRVGTGLAVAGAVHAAVNARLLRRPAAGATTARRVSVLLPVRDEVRNVAACLATLRAQPVAEILVLDDGSTDGTAGLARAAAAGDARVRVLAGTPPPPGWLGKLHACAQLAAAADPASEVLVFVDADVRLVPGAVAAAVDLLDRTGLDLVCPYPRQVSGTAGERLVQPLLQWSWLTFLPLRAAERSPRPSLSAANGQFLVVRRPAYEAAGGHAAVRDAVLDDLALLRAVKTAGGRGVVVDGTALAECRMYDGWGELRDGYGKSLWAAFGSEPGAVGVLAVLGLAYVVPPAAALRGSRAGALGYAAAVAGRAVSAHRTGGRVWPDAFAHPASVLALGGLTLRSLRLRRRGATAWKGRPV